MTWSITKGLVIKYVRGRQLFYDPLSQNCPDFLLPLPHILPPHILNDQSLIQLNDKWCEIFSDPEENKDDVSTYGAKDEILAALSSIEEELAVD